MIIRKTKNEFFNYTHDLNSGLIRIESSLKSYRWVDILSDNIDEIRNTILELKRITIEKTYNDADIEYVISKYRKTDKKFSVLVNLKPVLSSFVFAKYNIYNTECDSIQHALDIAEYGMNSEIKFIIEKFVNNEFSSDVLELIEIFN